MVVVSAQPGWGRRWSGRGLDSRGYAVDSRGHVVSGDRRCVGMVSIHPERGPHPDDEPIRVSRRGKAGSGIFGGGKAGRSSRGRRPAATPQAPAPAPTPTSQPTAAAPTGHPSAPTGTAPPLPWHRLPRRRGLGRLPLAPWSACRCSRSPPWPYGGGATTPPGPCRPSWSPGCSRSSASPCSCRSAASPSRAGCAAASPSPPRPRSWRPPTHRPPRPPVPAPPPPTPG